MLARTTDTFQNQPSKAILIVKPGYESKVAKIFDNTNIKITSSGQRHLGAVVDEEYRKEYIEEAVLLLSKIAGIQPQAAYSTHKHGFKSKYIFFNCTIPTTQNHMKIIEDVLRNHFIPAIIG